MIRTSNARTAVRLAAALMIGTAASAIVALPANAQVNNASLRGRITAPQNAMPTQVVAIDVGSGYRRTVQVGADGTYNFPALRAGQYKLEVTSPAGTRSTDVFTLSIGQNAVFDFDLTPATPAAGEAPAAEATAGAEAGTGDVIVTGNRIRRLEGGTVGVTITPRLIDQLPQINRNFLAFADLAPGVQFITGPNGDSRLQGGAQASSTVNVFIDGVSQKDYVLKNGVTGQDSSQGNPFPQLAIGEYQVLSSNYKAEFDQVSSVAITAGTKSGTNEFHGEGFFDFTNQDLRAARPVELYGNNARGKIPTRDMQFGGALGGPIVKDVLHFFVTYEGKRRRQPSDVNPGANLPITFFPERYRDRFGSFNETFNEDLYFGKINFAPTSKDMFEFSGKYRKESGEDFNGGISAFDTRSTLRVKEWRGLARWEHTEDSWVNDFKVAYEDVMWNPEPIVNGNVTLFQARTLDPTSGVSRRDDILRFGAGSSFQDKGQKGWTVSDDFTFTGVERHTFKVGVKAKWVTLNTLEQNNINPVYTYFTPQGGSFNDTLPWRLQFAALTAGDPRINSKNFQLGLYAQDDWDVTDRLTLNLGVRWDYERTPAFLNYRHDPAVVALVTGQTRGADGQPLYPNLLNADYDINDYISTGNERKSFKGAWQPRIGFTYKLTDDGRFAIFGGFGRSYDRNQFDFLQQELTQGLFAGRTFNFYTNGGAQPDPENVCNPATSPSTCILWNPIYLTQAGRDQLLAGAGAAGARELRFIKNDLKMPYSDQFSLGIRGQVGNLDLEAGYNRQQSRDGFVYLLGNRRPDGTFFPPTGTPGSPFSFTPPGYGSIIIGDNGLETNADSGYFKLVKRYSQASPWSIDATYTYTKAEENRKFGEVFSLDFPNLDAYPFLPSAGVRRHRFVMAGTVDVPMGLTISGKFQIASPLYFSTFLDTAGTPGTREGRSVESEGNGDRWGYRQMDLSVTKYVPLGFINDDTRIRFRVDIINLFNDRNYNGFNEITGLRDPNNYTTDGLPRTVKLSAGFNF